MPWFNHRKRDESGGDPDPEGILPKRIGGLGRGLGDEDLSPETTRTRIELLHALIADGSFEAAQRVFKLIEACDDEDESILHNRLHAELSLLAAIPHRSDEQERRRVVVAIEIVATFGRHLDPEVRAHALMAEATLWMDGGPTAAAWLERVRQREDFEELMNFDSLRATVEVLTQMVSEDRPDHVPESLPQHAAETARVRDLLRWWTEPGAPLPKRQRTADVPPPGAVGVTIADEVDAHDALALAAQLAADLRFGDSLICVRAVRVHAERDGHDLTAALAHVIEGQLLCHVDKVSEAAERLWEGAGRLWATGWHQAAGQAFLDLARLGAQHPELDAVLSDRVEVARASGPAPHLFAVTYVAARVFEVTGDALGVWSAALARAHLQHATGDGPAALRALANLGPAPAGDGRDALIAQAALLTVQAQLDTGGPRSAREALTVAAQTIAGLRPWFAWQLNALRGAVALADGDLEAAWQGTMAAMTTLRQLRWVIGDEHDRSSWVTSRRKVWATALQIAARRSPEDALAVIEDAKSAHLVRLILANATASPDPDTAALVRHALTRLALRGEDVTSLDVDRLGRAFDAAADAVTELRKRDALLAAAVDPPPFDAGVLGQLAAEIEDFALISYCDLGAHSIWAVTATAAGVIDLQHISLDPPTRRTLERLDATGAGHGIEDWIESEEGEHAMADLGRQLLTPLRALAGRSHSNLLIAPSGPLNNVPWGLLGDDDDVALIDRFAITLMPSLAISRALLARRRSTGPPVVLLCDPELNLANTYNQLKGIAALWSDVVARSGHDTSFTALRDLGGRGELGSYGWLVWIGHGLPHPSEPLASGLLLDDGTVLSAGLIGALKIPSAVDLWTCSASAETRLAGDEQLGLIAAMIGAGARSVMATCWGLDDSWVTDLSDRYYRALAGGVTRAAALRQAQRESRQAIPRSVWGAVMLWGLPA